MIGTGISSGVLVGLAHANNQISGPDHVESVTINLRAGYLA